MSSLYQILERCKELDVWGCPMDPDKSDFFSVFAEKHKSLRMCRVLAQKYRDQPPTRKLLFPFVSLSISDCLILLTHYFRDLILLFLDKQTAYGRAKFPCTPYKSGVRWRRWERYILILRKAEADYDSGSTLKSKVWAPANFLSFQWCSNFSCRNSWVWGIITRTLLTCTASRRFR
jgi:hypothetical protein